MKSGEILGLSIASIHNLTFYMWLVSEARKHIGWRFRGVEK
jgi:queuine tRNA-ribosyltransferase